MSKYLFKIFNMSTIKIKADPVKMLFVIGENRHTRKMACDFSNVGYELKSIFNSLHAAVNALRKEKFDFVIVDIDAWPNKIRGFLNTVFKNKLLNSGRLILITTKDELYNLLSQNKLFQLIKYSDFQELFYKIKSILPEPVLEVSIDELKKIAEDTANNLDSSVEKKIVDDIDILTPMSHNSIKALSAVKAAIENIINVGAEKLIVNLKNLKGVSDTSFPILKALINKLKNSDLTYRIIIDETFDLSRYKKQLANDINLFMNDTKKAIELIKKEAADKKIE